MASIIVVPNCLHRSKTSRIVLACLRLKQYHSVYAKFDIDYSISYADGKFCFLLKSSNTLRIVALRHEYVWHERLSVFKYNKLYDCTAICNINPLRED